LSNSAAGVDYEQNETVKIAPMPEPTSRTDNRESQMENGPVEYQKMAELCRNSAKYLNDGRDRDRWLRIAEGWTVLARDTVRARNFTTAAKLVVPIVSEQRV
jgi:hypothetical protein